METVFDHNITDAEFKTIIMCSKERYLNIVSQKIAYRDIAFLYYIRGDRHTAEKYIGKTNDVDTINSFWRIATHE